MPRDNSAELEALDERLENAQKLIDTARQVVHTAEDARDTVDKARRELRLVGFVVLGAAAALAVVAVVSRRHR